jgi:hypothetical protein
VLRDEAQTKQGGVTEVVVVDSAVYMCKWAGFNVQDTFWQHGLEAAGSACEHARLGSNRATRTRHFPLFPQVSTIPRKQQSKETEWHYSDRVGACSGTKHRQSRGGVTEVVVVDSAVYMCKWAGFNV